MKLLVITQKVDIDDDLLGFFHSWLLELAKNRERLMVICLQAGRHELPGNVKVLSLGKEAGKKFQVLRRFTYVVNFYKYIWRERKNYDAVFVHMNAEYVILGGLIWRALGKKIGFWYLHKSVGLPLRLAGFLTHSIFTASPESCRLKSRKIKIVGHGIEVKRFINRGGRLTGDQFKIVYVGRIAQIKNQKLLIEAVHILSRQKKEINFIVELIGAPVYERDRVYQRDLASLIKQYNLSDYVKFIGRVPNNEIARHYWAADLSINLCPTGGMDKAVLESMAAGVPAIALNKAFVSVFGRYSDQLILPEEKARELAEKISGQMKLMPDVRDEMSGYLSDIARQNFSLEKLIKKIIAVYE